MSTYERRPSNTSPSGLPHITQTENLQSFGPVANHTMALGMSSSAEFDPVGATSYEDLPYLQSSVGQPDGMQSQQNDASSAEQFYFQTQLTSGYNNTSYVQKPGPTTMMNSMSPSTVQNHVSPEPYLSDQAISDPTHFGATQLEQAMASAQFGFGSPLMPDDGQSAGPYAPYSYDDRSYSNMMTSVSPMAQNSGSASNYSSRMHSPLVGKQTSPSMNDNGSYAMPANPTSLALNAQQFGNHNFTEGDTLNTTVPYQSTSDFPAPQPRLLSPIVRVENYGDDPQQAPNMTPSLSKRSHSSRRSNTHLSPYLDDQASDEDEDQNEDILQSSAASVNRNEDGSWVHYGPNGQAGIGPVERDNMNSQDIPTLDELEEQRVRAGKLAEVEDWLTNSEAASDSGDAESGPKSNRRRKQPTRPRAKSANDAGLQPNFNTLQVTSAYPSAPGPGAIINEPSEIDEDEDDGSFQSENDGSDSPPAKMQSFSFSSHDIWSVHPRDTSLEFLGAAVDDSALTKPWADLEAPPAESTARPSQPSSSNAAIMRFKLRAKETDAASLTATVGSGRRRSESDIGSLVAAAGISKEISIPEARGKPKESRWGIVNSILPNRNNSRKRKSNASSVTPSQQPPSKAQTPPPSTPKRMGSFGRPKTPRLDTNISSARAEAKSPGSVTSTFYRARSAIRSRSKSDLVRASKSPGLTDLLTQHGGLPVVTLASPSIPFGEQLDIPLVQGEDDSGDEDNVQDGVTMDLAVRSDMVVVPTYDGFKYQIGILNPRVKGYLLERLTQEQSKRYKRMLDLKMRHSEAVSRRQCNSKEFCVAMGGEAKTLPPKANGKSPDNAPVVFQIIAPGASERDIEANDDGQAIPAQFAPGVPNPPVKFLPAKFECPYCFKVKEFKKPSDWTKHVHEDVQPFTCTFPECNEPKSFKRKADWVRHENERHRQLESWTCNNGDCAHTCFRRDNFVQHLVREHKVPEPKVRTGRNAGAKSPYTPTDGDPMSHTYNFPTGESVEDYVAKLVDQCRHDSTKQAKDEPCRFCGNSCTTWKKLTVHLAKHMEQISMPVIALVEQKRGMTENSMDGFEPAMGRGAQWANPGGPNTTIPTFLYEEPSEMDSGTMMGLNGAGSQMQATYPQPGLTLGLQNQLSQQSGFDTTLNGFVGQSWPPLMVPGRSRATSFDVQSLAMSRQGSILAQPNIGSQSPSPMTGDMAGYEQQDLYSSMDSYGSRSMDGMGNGMFP